MNKQLEPAFSLGILKKVQEIYRAEDVPLTVAFNQAVEGVAMAAFPAFQRLMGHVGADYQFLSDAERTNGKGWCLEMLDQAIGGLE